MPSAAYQECRYPRCPSYAERAGYCAVHAPVVQQSLRYGRLNPANKRFRWMRSAFLNQHPMCAWCITEPATVLDHITPHRGIPHLFWDQRNWQGLCVACHGRKTAQELWSRGA
jgi:5-methylcytosine-specific restriction enzyme A